MPFELDSARKHMGTKVRLFPQPSFVEPYSEPETVWLSPPAGTVGPGPNDDRMYVIDPVGKERGYGLRRGPNGSAALDLPPWRGALHAPAEPDAAGHFDHFAVGTPEFEMAHVYGSLRWTLDIWQDYFGRPIPWHFRRDYERLEAIMFPRLDNARSGYGFIEVGADITDWGEATPFSLNFDILAHELGHSIIYSEIGIPTLHTEQGEYFGFHESAADMVALIAVLHFDSVVDHLLGTTSGNLYTLNELNRVGELSKTEQIRTASNPHKMSDFAAGWTDEHLLSQPLTGALFDILVDVFDENLLERGLISARAEDLMDQIERRPEFEGVIQAIFDRAYANHHAGFKEALLEARDYLGAALAITWSELSPHFLNYDDVGDALLEADRRLTGGRYQRIILSNFRWREIGAVKIGPRLKEPDETSHAFSDRTLVPEPEKIPAKLSYYERMMTTRRHG